MNTRYLLAPIKTVGRNSLEDIMLDLIFKLILVTGRLHARIVQKVCKTARFESTCKRTFGSTVLQMLMRQGIHEVGRTKET